MIPSSDTFADVTGIDTPLTDTPPALAVLDAAAEALKQDYVTCERAAASSSNTGWAVPAACSVLYEDLRVRVFRGDIDALIGWFRQAWNDRDGSTR